MGKTHNQRISELTKRLEVLKREKLQQDKLNELQAKVRKLETNVSNRKRSVTKATLKKLQRTSGNISRNLNRLIGYSFSRSRKETKSRQGINTKRKWRITKVSTKKEWRV